MTDGATCEEVRELAPELALGATSGEERARALAHLSRCAECRRVVDDLARVTDEVLLLAPQREPPPGFEGRVLSRWRAQRPARGRRRAIAAAVAAALVAAGGAWGGTLAATKLDRQIGGYYREILGRVNGKYFSAAPLRTEGDRQVGSVFMYEGKPSWIFVVVRKGAVPGMREVVLVPRRGAAVHLATMHIGREGATWGTQISSGVLGTLAAVRLVDRGGGTMLEAVVRDRS